MDFNDISDKVPVQEFDIPQDRNIAEYVVKYVLIYFCPLRRKGSDSESDTSGRQSLATFLP